eukprot:scaffold31844_cov27-Tisochrysis_lutea.AAC.4
MQQPALMHVVQRKRELNEPHEDLLLSKVDSAHLRQLDPTAARHHRGSTRGSRRLPCALACACAPPRGVRPSADVRRRSATASAQAASRQ